MTRDTAGFTGLTVNLSINYGGRDEIIRAFRRHRESGSAEASDGGVLRRYLDQPDLPDPDLIIRTANEQRLSNFLLWESAYAELYFSPKLWPDWDKADLFEALDDYARRSRHLRRCVVNWKVVLRAGSCWWSWRSRFSPSSSSCCRTCTTSGSTSSWSLAT